MEDMNLQALQDLLTELQKVLNTIREEAKKGEGHGSFQPSTFFDSIRPMFTGGKLTATQVEGIEAKIKVFRDSQWSVPWTAYALATSFHETAQRMQPVREGLNASDSWRRAHLRYYPYYGRGDVQLTWKSNYERADKELGLGGRLLAKLDLALDPEISAQVMWKGMSEGWFAGDAKGRHTLERHLPNAKGSLNEYKEARRIINGTDKAALIAGYAIKFEEALRKSGY